MKYIYYLLVGLDLGDYIILKLQVPKRSQTEIIYVFIMKCSSIELDLKVGMLSCWNNHTLGHYQTKASLLGTH